MKNFKKAMKNFKKVRLSMGMKIIALLSCVALLSMGFASWWIIKVEQPAITNGSFTTYEVEEKGVKLDNISFATATPSTIVWGLPTSSEISTKFTGTTKNYNWLRSSNGEDAVQVSNLTASYTFDVYVTDGAATADNTTASSEVKLSDVLKEVTITVAPNNVSLFEDAITAGYITGPSISYSINGVATTVTGQNGSDAYDKTNDHFAKVAVPINTSTVTATGKITVTVTITFGWGEAFGNENPYLYYNAIDPSTNSSITGTAKSALKTLHTKLTSVGYTIDHDLVSAD